MLRPYVWMDATFQGCDCHRRRFNYSPSICFSSAMSNRVSFTCRFHDRCAPFACLDSREVALVGPSQARLACALVAGRQLSQALNWRVLARRLELVDASEPLAQKLDWPPHSSREHRQLPVLERHKKRTRARNCRHRRAEAESRREARKRSRTRYKKPAR